MNLPNMLTMSRLFLALIMMILLELTFPYSKTLALLTFAIAGMTDYLDGYIARKQGITTPFGKLMDPLTDKVMVCAAFVSFVEIQIHRGSSPGTVPLVPAWIVVLIISREFLVTGLRLLAASRGDIIAAGRWGKHKTVWQIIAIIVILLGLAVRNDLLRGSVDAAAAGDRDAKILLANYDLAFTTISWSVASAVALITLASGMMYFFQHRELLSRRTKRD